MGLWVNAEASNTNNDTIIAPMNIHKSHSIPLGQKILGPKNEVPSA